MRNPTSLQRIREGICATLLAPVAAAALLAGGSLVWTMPAVATSIAILVNDDPITQYDIDQRSKLINATTGGRASNPKQAAIDELIDEKLKMQEARRLGITVAEAEVDQAFNTIASRVNLPPSQFSQALQQIGVNPATLKKRLQADLSWRDVVRSRFRSDVRIRDRDIETALARKGEEMPTTSEELALQQVVLIIPSGSSADYMRQRRQDAQSYRSKYSGCDSAREIAKSYRDIVVKETVRRNSADLGPQIMEMLKGLTTGGISAPNEMQGAIEMIGICDRHETTDTTAARKQVQSELMLEQGDRLSRRLLIDLKQSAVIEYR